jgi:hypothetical protein
MQSMALVDFRLDAINYARIWKRTAGAGRARVLCAWVIPPESFALRLITLGQSKRANRRLDEYNRAVGSFTIGGNVRRWLVRLRNEPISREKSSLRAASPLKKQRGGNYLCQPHFLNFIRSGLVIPRDSTMWDRP